MNDISTHRAHRFNLKFILQIPMTKLHILTGNDLYQNLLFRPTEENILNLFEEPSRIASLLL